MIDIDSTNVGQRMPRPDVKMRLFVSFWVVYHSESFEQKKLMASRRIEDLHPSLAYAFGKAEANWKAQNPAAPQPFIVCTHRPDEEQNMLFKAKPKLTNARAGESPHNYLPALAFDIAFKLPNGAVTYETTWFDQFAPFVKASAGITWGGDFRTFKDRPHFELMAWRVLAKKP